MPTLNNKPRAAVVGSGFGGLGVAIRLQAMGYQVDLFEQHDKPGGRAYVFEEQGFRFDAGPTVVTAPECLEELFTLCGRRLADYVELIPVSPMYRLYWEDGTRFDYVTDEAQLLKNLSEISPSDAARYHDFYNYTRKVYDEGYVKLCHVPFQNLWDMVKVAPELLRLKAHRSVYDVVSEYFSDAKVRQAFSFNSLLIGGNPFKASAIYTLIHPLERAFGVYFPRGGTHALVMALARLFQDLGGELKLSTPVRALRTRGDAISGLVTGDGKEYAYPLVVSNADVHHTYANLLQDTRRGREVGRDFANKTQSMSLFVLYFGTKAAYPDLVQHNVMFGPRYRELLSDIFDRGHIADDFSLYLHAPSLTDPSLAPAGCHSYYVLSPVPHLGHKHPADWDQLATTYGDRILDYLEQHYMPGLRSNLVLRRHFTPKHFAERLNALHGSAFSLAPTLTQSAYFRTHNRDDQIKGLYFVGAGTHPGAGIPGVIGSAKATASVIANDQARLLAKAKMPRPWSEQQQPSQQGL